MDEEEKKLHHGHRSRMWERFYQKGADTMMDYEILEMLLYGPIRRANTNPIAHRLINKFGSVRGVLDAPIEELMTVKGVGEKTALFLKVAAEFILRYTNRTYSDLTLDIPHNIAVYFKEVFKDTHNEQYAVIAVDYHMAPLSCRKFDVENFKYEKEIAANILLQASRMYSDRIVIAHFLPTDEWMSYHRLHLPIAEQYTNVLADFGIAVCEYFMCSYAGSFPISYLDPFGTRKMPNVKPLIQID